MKSILSFLQSSIGKKVLMSLTGLSLITFLVEHVVGNLLLLRNDDGAFYDAYAEFMVANPWVRIIEVLLFASLVGHALSGGFVWLQNRLARPQSYKVYKLSENTTLASRITMLTGSIIFLCLVVHLRRFFELTRFGEGHPSVYLLVQSAFSNPWYNGFSLLALILLAYHLRQGFQSAFRTLGVFAVRRINLLKIESRPLVGKPWEYLFYLDVEGSRHEDNVAAALKEVQAMSTFHRILGSYPVGPTIRG